MNGDICPTHLVTDAPSDSDAFGAHGRIAQAIAQLVRNSAGGKSVGLLGTWGAGKSTVVEILRKDLERDSRFVVWLFDAWAHEGDSLRRMFLESLTERLRAKTWLDGKEWKERLEYLAGRRKVVEQSNTPRLSPLAVMLAVSLLLVPLGLELWSKRLDVGLAMDRSLPVDWGAVLAVVSALAPLLVFVGYIVWLLIRGTSLADVRGKVADALTLFVRQTDTASRTETLDSGEPTSLEFERLFCDVMDAALTPPAVQPDPDRRLVLVIDNLDRVGPEQALAVWSTLQTFVRQREGHEPWLNRLWCLLPFDGDAIRRLWPQDASAGRLADSFLDKTFQVRFEVPLPLLSDWKDYMTARLKEAMPSHTDDDFFRVYRLYTVRRTMSTPSPTPRELKLFVNQVGSLHRQWQDEIPLPDLAYYALLQRDKVAVTSESIGQFPAPGEAGLVSSRVREHLAALAYGVPIDSARELLLREPILRALETAAPQELNTLSESSDAFWLMLEQALERGCEEWPTAEGGNLLHAAYAIDQSDIHTREPKWRTGLLFRRIAEATAGVGSWTPMDERTIDGMAILGHHHPDLTSRLFDAFVATRMQAKEWGTSAAVTTFLDDYEQLVKTLLPDRPRVPVHGTTETYKRFAWELVTRDPGEQSWDRFPPVAPDALLSDLSSPSNVFDAASVETVRVARASGAPMAWKTFADSADKRIRDAIGAAQTSHLLAALHVLDVETAAVDALKGLVSGGVARDAVLSSESVTREPGLLGAWLYTFVRFGSLSELAAGQEGSVPAVTQWFTSPFVKESEPVAEALAAAAMKMGRAELLFDVAQSTPQAAYAMLTAVSRLADMKPPLSVFPLGLFERWNTSFPNVDPYYSARVLYEGRPAFFSELSSRPFRTDLAGVYAAVIDVAGEERALYDLCVRGVQEASTNDWNASFGNQFGLSKLVDSLTAKGVKVSLGQAAGDAMVRFLEILGSSYRSVLAHETVVFEALDPGARESVVKAVIDKASVVAQRKNVGHLLTLIKYAVFESHDLLDSPKALVAITRHLLKEFNDEWVERLGQAVSGKPPLTQLDDDVQGVMKLIATEQAKRTHEGARLALAQLAAFFGGGEGAAPVSQQSA